MSNDNSITQTCQFCNRRSLIAYIDTIPHYIYTAYLQSADSFILCGFKVNRLSRFLCAITNGVSRAARLVGPYSEQNGQDLKMHMGNIKSYLKGKMQQYTLIPIITISKMP